MQLDVINIISFYISDEDSGLQITAENEARSNIYSVTEQPEFWSNMTSQSPSQGKQWGITDMSFCPRISRLDGRTRHLLDDRQIDPHPSPQYLVLKWKPKLWRTMPRRRIVTSTSMVSRRVTATPAGCRSWALCRYELPKRAAHPYIWPATFLPQCLWGWLSMSHSFMASLLASQEPDQVPCRTLPTVPVGGPRGQCWRSISFVGSWFSVSPGQAGTLVMASSCCWYFYVMHGNVYHILYS